MEFFRDVWGFVRNRKKFWLLPALITLVGIGALVAMAGSSVTAPFIYAIF